MSRVLRRLGGIRCPRRRPYLENCCRALSTSAPLCDDTIKSRNQAGGGFVVLLPEVPNDTPETNSLLRFEDTPQFGNLSKENYSNAVQKLALELESKVWSIENQLKDPKFPRTYDTVIEPLEASSACFDYVWSVLKSLNVVTNNYFPSEGYNRIHERAREARSKKFLSVPIYHACKEIKSDTRKLNEPQKRVLDKFLLEGRLSGVELTGNAATQLAEAGNKIAEEKGKFAHNVEKATLTFKHFIVEAKYMGDMPQHLLKAMARDKSQPQKGPWFVKLTSPSYKAFLEYCPEPGLRWNAWNAYNIRASGYSDTNINNSVHIEEIRSKRQDQAKLLGYENYVDLSMQTKMAGTEDNVQIMLATLLSHAKPIQEGEFDELMTFATSRGFEGIFRPWDVDFWRRRQRQSLFNVDMELFSEYFPFPEVWKNLCSFAQDIFGIRFKESKAEAWHEDVSYYEVFDENNNQLLGSFYLDPYTRPGEKLMGYEWMIGNRNLCGIPNFKPLATLIFNFAPPLYGKPTLLSFEDMQALFGKFGHLLQHLLTLIPYQEVSGTNSMEWDSAFVAQKFMRNWLGNKAIVKEMSSHFDNGSKIPDDMVRNMLRSRKHMAATDLCHELYLSALDIDLYSRKDFWMDIMKNLWPIYHSPLQLDKRDSHVCSHVSIFSGDFAAAYYSILWSQMLAADAYQKFVEKDQGRDAWRKHGRRFRETFLSMGGGYHPNTVFREFRGRDPSLDAILWTLGIKPMTIVEPDARTTEASKPASATQTA